MTTCGNIILRGCVPASIAIGKSIKNQLSSPKTVCVMQAISSAKRPYLITLKFYIRLCKTELIFGAISGGAPGIILSGTLALPKDLAYMNAIWRPKNVNHERAQKYSGSLHITK